MNKQYGMTASKAELNSGSCSVERLVGRFGVRTQNGWLYRLTPHGEHRATFGNKRSALALDHCAAKGHAKMLREIAPHLRCRVLPLSLPNSNSENTKK